MIYMIYMIKDLPPFSRCVNPNSPKIPQTCILFYVQFVQLLEDFHELKKEYFTFRRYQNRKQSVCARQVQEYLQRDQQ